MDCIRNIRLAINIEDKRILSPGHLLYNGSQEWLITRSSVDAYQWHELSEFFLLILYSIGIVIVRPEIGCDSLVLSKVSSLLMGLSIVWMPVTGNSIADSPEK